MSEPVLMTVPDFLRSYAISRTSFYEQVNQGKLRIVKRGRRTLVTSDDAAAWIELLRQQTNGGVA